MSQRNFIQLISTAIAIALIVSGAGPAAARWQLRTVSPESLLYNQGVTFDPTSNSFFFDGVISATNSGLYRVNTEGSLVAANFGVLPFTKEGYNHTGDLSFDPAQRRVLLPLECYYPDRGGNTCGSGAIGVADPVSLRLLYYVNLDPAQIAKAMWVEISPDGRWLWTSSGTHLIAYRAADVSQARADGQRAGTAGGIEGTDLGPVLPDSGVTGAAFVQDPLTRTSRLFLSLNEGAQFDVVAYRVGVARDGSPELLSASPVPKIVVPKWFFATEPEGLAITSPLSWQSPFGGVLHWQVLPTITLFTLYSIVLNYVPRSTTPLPRGAIPARSLKAMSSAADRRIARGLGLTSAGQTLGPLR
jgi:hypothetical protein